MLAPEPLPVNTSFHFLQNFFHALYFCLYARPSSFSQIFLRKTYTDDKIRMQFRVFFPTRHRVPATRFRSKEIPNSKYLVNIVTF